MGKIFPLIETFRTAAGPHWVRMAVVIGGAVYSVSGFINGFAENTFIGFIIPTWPRVGYTLAALAVLLVFWFWKYAHNLRLESLPKIKFVRLGETSDRAQEGVTEVKISLHIQNTGTAALSKCLIKVDGLAGSEAMHGHQHPSRALRTSTQQDQDRRGEFNLRGGESKEIPLCHYRYVNGDTFAQVIINYEDGDRFSFDPENYNHMVVGFYSESAPEHIKLKFERMPTGLVKITEIKEQAKC